MENTYYKVLKSNLVHDGIIFTKGLNVLPGDFNDEPETYYDSDKHEYYHGYYCEHFGFTIYNINNIFGQISTDDDNTSEIIAKISLPDDTKTKTIDGELKVNMIEIEEIILIKDFINSMPLIAVQQNGMLLKYIDTQTEEICLAAVKRTGCALQFVKNQTEEICIEAIKNSGYLKFVKDQTEKICLIAIHNGHSLSDIKEQTKEICIAAVSKIYTYGNILQSVKIYTPVEDYKEICITAVKNQGFEYKYVLKQYLELDKYPDSYADICIEAIKSNSNVFRYLTEEEKTFEVCMTAVKISGFLLQYINSKMPRYAEICIEAIKHTNSYSSPIQFIDQNIEEYDLICLEAVKKNGMLLNDIKKQTKEICYEAVKQNPHALQFVIDQTDEISKIALKQFCQPIIGYLKNKTHVDALFC
jgi:hypothetical protein